MKKSILLILSVLFVSCIFAGCAFNIFGKKSEDTPWDIKSIKVSKLTANGKRFSVEGTSDGIKITIKDGTIRDNSGSIFTVYDKSLNELPLHIAIYNEQRNSRKEYTYRFVEPGKEYIVCWFCNFDDNKGGEFAEWDYAKCKAGGGIDLSDYLNLSAVNKASMSIDYDKTTSEFCLSLRSNCSKYTDFIKDDSIFSDITFMFRVLLGEVNWTNTEYVTDKFLNLKQNVSGDKSTVDESIVDAKSPGYHILYPVDADKKKQYSNKYCGQLFKKFEYKESSGAYSKTLYEQSVWTDQKKF